MKIKSIFGHLLPLTIIAIITMPVSAHHGTAVSYEQENSSQSLAR